SDGRLPEALHRFISFPTSPRGARGRAHPAGSQENCSRDAVRPRSPVLRSVDPRYRGFRGRRARRITGRIARGCGGRNPPVESTEGRSLLSAPGQPGVPGTEIRAFPDAAPRPSGDERADGRDVAAVSPQAGAPELSLPVLRARGR